MSFQEVTHVSSSRSESGDEYVVTNVFETCGERDVEIRVCEFPWIGGGQKVGKRKQDDAGGQQCKQLVVKGTPKGAKECTKTSIDFRWKKADGKPERTYTHWYYGRDQGSTGGGRDVPLSVGLERRETLVGFSSVALDADEWILDSPAGGERILLFPTPYPEMLYRAEREHAPRWFRLEVRTSALGGVDLQVLYPDPEREFLLEPTERDRWGAVLLRAVSSRTVPPWIQLEFTTQASGEPTDIPFRFVTRSIVAVELTASASETHPVQAPGVPIFAAAFQRPRSMLERGSSPFVSGEIQSYLRPAHGVQSIMKRYGSPR